MSKKLGQYFLTHKVKIRKIVDALELKDGDVVVEVGPGRGALTRELGIMNYELRIMAVEKDVLLAEKLESEVKNYENSIEIISGDILKVLPSIIHDSSFKIREYKLVGNIPFYLTGRLLRVVGELEYKPSVVVFVVQKEVGERMCAKPPKMNLLAASVQLWANAQIVGNISRKRFRPQPEVDTVIIRLTPNALNYADGYAELRGIYYKMIKALFKQPRKTILNNLLTYEVDRLNRERVVRILRAAGVDPNDRPQNLSIEEITRLSQLLYNSANEGESS